MNIDGLIRKYFSDIPQMPVIELFDDKNIHQVFEDIVNILKHQPDIELGVLQTLSYCFYEVLDNVLTHSTKSCGTAVMRYSPQEMKIQIMVVDDGVGIHSSLTSNSCYRGISEAEAIAMCLHDRVTDGKGMGFGLYSMLCLIRKAGILLCLHSGHHMLISDGKNEHVEEATFWQGTIVYFELRANQEIDPDSVLENRTDAATQFNEAFIDLDDMENLW